MKDQKHVAWLHEQLPTLVSEGVLPPEVAERLRQRYGEPQEGGAKRWAMTLFSIIGAVLIGGGIILLLAHNWEQLSRPARAVLSFAPLLIAQALAAWILWTNRPSTAWREGVGAAWALSVGACIALISQTYNIGGDFGDYMLTWTLLALPAAYLLGATVPALLYIVGATVWAGAVHDEGNKALFFWPLVGLVLPYLWWTGRANRYHIRPVLGCWVLAIATAIGLGFTARHVLGYSGYWIVAYSSLFAAFYLMGNRWFGEATASWQKPLQTVGTLGAVWLMLMFTFESPWKEFVRDHSWSGFWQRPNASTIEEALALLWPLAGVAFWLESFRRRDPIPWLLGAWTIVAAVSWSAVIQSEKQIWLAQVLCNAYVLATGVGILVGGIRERLLDVVNSGMVILAALIMCRFFDADIGFVTRGVAFIILGIGFLVTNLILVRWKGAKTA